MVFRQTADGKTEVLLLRKPRKNDAWQLPQGGVEEGETLEVAALRELKEEAGIDAEVLGRSQEVYQYDFPASYRRFRPDNVCGQKVEFVFAKADPRQEVVVDNDEIEAFAWVDPADITEYSKRKEYIKLFGALVQEGTVFLEHEQ